MKRKTKNPHMAFAESVANQYKKRKVKFQSLKPLNEIVNGKELSVKEVEEIWKGISSESHKHLTFDGSKYHKIISFKESDGQSFADSIELETDATKRWRVKHYQERWMEKKDMIKFYELILNVIKKL